MDHLLHHQWNIFLLQLLAGFIRCYCHYQVCNLPADWDMCSWKGQFGKTRSWKVFSWQVRHEIRKNEVGKFGLKLKISRWSWKVTDEVRKFVQLQRIFPTSEQTFQLRLVLSNFAGLFPTQRETFQLQPFQLSNFSFQLFQNFNFFNTTLRNFQLR